MKRFALLATLLGAAVVTGCGGGGASAPSTQSEGPSLAENSRAESQQHKRKEQARESRRKHRKEKEDREFKEHEEARIRRKEAERKQKEEADRKVSKPKPEATPESSSSEVDPIAAEEFHQFTGVDRENWEIAYEVCGSTPEEQLAREFHTEDNWSAIGHAYGSEEYREPFNIAPEEGCMAALKVSKAQWEATLEGLPFKEL
jgi:hypothetical protein